MTGKRPRRSYVRRPESSRDLEAALDQYFRMSGSPDLQPRDRPMTACPGPFGPVGSAPGRGRPRGPEG